MSSWAWGAPEASEGCARRQWWGVSGGDMGFLVARKPKRKERKQPRDSILPPPPICILQMT